METERVGNRKKERRQTFKVITVQCDTCYIYGDYAYREDKFCKCRVLILAQRRQQSIGNMLCLEHS